MTPLIYTFHNGILRIGNDVLPLPVLPESPWMHQRVAFAVLLHFFGDEHQPERKATVLHKQLARYFSAVVEPAWWRETDFPRWTWSLSVHDLQDLVVEVLLAHSRALQTEPVEIEYISGQRRDLLRELSTPLHK